MNKPYANCRIHVPADDSSWYVATLAFWIAGNAAIIAWALTALLVQS